MSFLSINSNLISLRSQRQLSSATETVARTYERLSSGLRINRASDDAAGLAISDGIGSSVRVYTQAIRNANDGLSALSIASGALNEANSTIIRLRELAELAANGTYSRAQRNAMGAESDELVREFNRIIATTKFNGLGLLDGTLNNTTLQLGYGTQQALRVELGSRIGRTVGTGSFGTSTYYSTTDNANDVAAEDIDGDGDRDMVTADIGAGMISVRFNDGTGTFGAATNYAVGAEAAEIEVRDFNGDGRLDIATVGQNTGSLYVRLNQGGGVFGAQTSVASGLASLRGVASGDLDGDGDFDLAVAGGTANGWGVYLNDGNGNFTLSFNRSLGAQNDSIEIGDFDGDGNLDVLNVGINSIVVQQGDGRGNFTTESTYALSGGAGRKAAIGDINRDGILDVVVGRTGAGSLDVLIGSGSGSFSQGTTVSFGANPRGVALGDVNGDGILDLAVQDAAGSQAFFAGAGNGTFSLLSSSTVGMSSMNSITLADLNGDSVLDVLSTNALGTRGAYVQFGATRQTSEIALIDLRTRQGALSAMSVLEAAMLRTAQETASIGAYQSRLETALSAIAATKENLTAAQSRIRDADMAAESAALIRSRILQQTASSVLAQANLMPALAIQLLKNT